MHKFSMEDARKLSDDCESAAREAVREALIRHKKLGNSIATSINGKIVWIPADQIQIPELDSSTTDSSATAPPETKEAPQLPISAARFVRSSDPNSPATT